MVQRNISPKDVKEVLKDGEILKHYQNDKPHPSVLMFKTIQNRPIHIVVGRNENNGECTIITVYIAGEEFWNPDFRTKK